MRYMRLSRSEAIREIAGELSRDAAETYSMYVHSLEHLDNQELQETYLETFDVCNKVEIYTTSQQQMWDEWGEYWEGYTGGGVPQEVVKEPVCLEARASGH
jgi:hypothetical protein